MEVENTVNAIKDRLGFEAWGDERPKNVHAMMGRRMSDAHYKAQIQARLAGKTCFIGDPCPSGHVNRYVRSGGCVTCKQRYGRG